MYLHDAGPGRITEGRAVKSDESLFKFGNPNWQSNLLYGRDYDGLVGLNVLLGIAGRDG